MTQVADPVFITGITGFVGKALALKLAELGHYVIGIARNPDKFCSIPDNIKIYKADLEDIESLDHLVKEKSLMTEQTTIYHIAAVLGAAQASKSTYQRINVEATESLLLMAVKYSVKKFVFVSSMGAAGPIGSYENPITEEMEEQPRAYYSRSKLDAEKLLLEKTPDEMDLIILRPPNIYGPGMNPKSGAALVFNGCKRPIFAIIGRGKNYINFAYIDNIVDGIHTCANNTTGHEVYFISDAEPYLVNSFITTIKQHIGSKTFIIKFPYLITFPLAWLVEKLGKLIRRDIGFNTELIKGMATNAYVFSIDKAKGIGFNPKVGLDEGVQKTLDFLSE